MLCFHSGDQCPRPAELTLQTLATRIPFAALGRLACTYRWFCDQVKEPETKYETASSILGTERLFGQTYLLWQIFGIEGKEVWNWGELSEDRNNVIVVVTSRECFLALNCCFSRLEDHCFKYFKLIFKFCCLQTDRQTFRCCPPPQYPMVVIKIRYSWYNEYYIYL